MRLFAQKGANPLVNNKTGDNAVSMLMGTVGASASGVRALMGKGFDLKAYSVSPKNQIQKSLQNKLNGLKRYADLGLPPSAERIKKLSSLILCLVDYGFELLPEMLQSINATLPQVMVTIEKKDFEKEFAKAPLKSTFKPRI